MVETAVTHPQRPTPTLQQTHRLPVATVPHLHIVERGGASVSYLDAAPPPTALTAPREDDRRILSTHRLQRPINPHPDILVEEQPRPRLHRQRRPTCQRQVTYHPEGVTGRAEHLVTGSRASVDPDASQTIPAEAIPSVAEAILGILQDPVLTVITEGAALTSHRTRCGQAQPCATIVC